MKMTTFYSNAAIFIVVFVLSFCFEAQALQKHSSHGCEKGVNDKEHQEFLCYLRDAEEGHPVAQFNVGVCYYNGYGIDQNYNQAFLWIKKAADRGDAVAQHSLAGCYHKGLGIGQNYKEAFLWYKKAADQGWVEAQYDLGFCFYHG